MAKTKITLIAQAAWLLNKPDATESEVVAHCALISDKIILVGDKMKTEKIPVYENEDVRWEGEAVDVGTEGFVQAEENWDFSVGIDYIIYTKRDQDENFFDRVVLQGNGNKNSKVTRKAKQGIEKLTYTYIIIFTVYGPFGSQQTFSIDPKLSGNN